MLGFDALAKLPLASLPGTASQTITPALFTDADTFYSATVSPGAVTLTPALYSDPDTFYAPQINLTIYPGLFTDGDTFYSPQVNLTIYPALFTDADTFYGATITTGEVFLSADLFVDADTFYSPLIGIGVEPPLYVDPDVFWPPVVGLGTPPQAWPANICQHSGFKTPPSKLARQWNGIVSCAADYDRRHPQELVRPVIDVQRVPVPRPEQADTFITAADVTADAL
jgi:hypothetical protein